MAGCRGEVRQLQSGGSLQAGPHRCGLKKSEPRSERVRKSPSSASWLHGPTDPRLSSARQKHSMARPRLQRPQIPAVLVCGTNAAVAPHRRRSTKGSRCRSRHAAKSERKRSGSPSPASASSLSRRPQRMRSNCGRGAWPGSGASSTRTKLAASTPAILAMIVAIVYLVCRSLACQWKMPRKAFGSALPLVTKAAQKASSTRAASTVHVGKRSCQLSSFGASFWIAVRRAVTLVSPMYSMGP
mmetsp:Transcript_50729/g.147209  ORF Transcript_50729/g.147209 Transcript_50729/m.147209 type:complete len:242 (+) Transcript_50729:109-834(+)